MLTCSPQFLKIPQPVESFIRALLKTTKLSDVCNKVKYGYVFFFFFFSIVYDGVAQEKKSSDRA